MNDEERRGQPDAWVTSARDLLDRDVAIVPLNLPLPGGRDSFDVDLDRLCESFVRHLGMLKA